MPNNCIFTCFLLCGFVCCGAQVTIVTPPENVTVCKESNVTISCGYQSNASLPVLWVINGITYNEGALLGFIIPSYRLNNQSIPLSYSLTIRFIRGSNVIQCGIESTPNITIYSTRGRVTVVEPTIKITTTIVQCRYIYVSWININAEICSHNEYFVTLSYQDRYQRTRRSFNTNQNNTDFNYLSDNTIYNFTVNAITLPERNSPTSNVEFLSLRTPVLQMPTPLMVTADLNFDTFVITVSWQAPNCTGDINTIMYNITVMDQYNSSAIVTVPANISSVEISQFSYNGTAIVANREYTITVLAISDQGTSYPSDPVVVSNIGSNCDSGDSNTGAIVGGVIGAAVVVIIIIIITAVGCFVYHKKKDSTYDDDKASLQREPMLHTSKSY